MIVKGNLTLKDTRPFCLFNKSEVGIAIDYFAGEIFVNTLGDEYITEETSQLFGWYDSNGDYNCVSKHAMTRPTNMQIAQACIMHEPLKNMAQEMGLIEIVEDIEDEKGEQGPSLNAMALYMGCKALSMENISKSSVIMQGFGRIFLN